MSGELQQKARLTFASGGWVILLAIVSVVGITAFALLGPMRGVKVIGDGRDPATYGFDLGNLSVPRESLAASGNPRDFLRALDLPSVMNAQQITARNETQRNKFAVPGDRVIGVELNGESRAYPLQLMNVHEIVNDIVGGIPIAVTYSPLCDSAVVFDRRSEGKVLVFGVSGLLINSNLVMYDRDPAEALIAKDPRVVSAHTPSLWSQLAFEAVAGPAAQSHTKLTLIPGVGLSTWASWNIRHPDSTVAMPDETDWRRMKEMDYRRYWNDGKVKYPVVQLAPDEADGFTIPFATIHPSAAPLLMQAVSEMTPIIAVSDGAGWKALPVRTLEDLVIAPYGYSDSSVLGVRREWIVVPHHGALLVETEETEPAPVMIPCLWFAWTAFHPAN